MDAQVIEKIEKTVSIPLPKLATANPQSTRVHGRVITTKVVGVSFRQDVTARLRMRDRVWLEKEESNPADHNAIKVSRSNGEQIGYLNRYLAASLAPHFRAYRYPVKGKVTSLTGSVWDGFTLGCVVTFKLPKLTPHKNGNLELDWDD